MTEHKYKVVVYAICKNEEKFVERWYESVKEADEIYVLDTGSTDDTVKKLKECGIHVKTKVFKPWRFDVARNESLKMVPDDTDICICTDLDEVFMPGWRKELEKYWQPDTTRARYNYNWSLDENNNPIVNFYLDKIHTKKDYKWTHPVHEVLTAQKEERVVTIDSITLNHYPDHEKSRSSYLPLLELSVKEDPENDRNVHYLGREYMYYHKWNRCIDTLIKHLSLKTATWKDERAASMRFIARSYFHLKRYREAEMWLKLAIEEAPYLRDGYTELAFLYYLQEEYEKCIHTALQALKIKTHPKTYINEVMSFDGTLYDLLAISSFRLKQYDYAVYWNAIALEYKPDDVRLQNNHQVYLQKEANPND